MHTMPMPLRAPAPAHGNSRGAPMARCASVHTVRRRHCRSSFSYRSSSWFHSWGNDQSLFSHLRSRGCASSSNSSSSQPSSSSSSYDDDNDSPGSSSSGDGGEVLVELPVFPLSTIAPLPTARIPLNIIEARYRVLFHTLVDGVRAASPESANEERATLVGPANHGVLGATPEGPNVDEGLVQVNSPFRGTARLGMCFFVRNSPSHGPTASKAFKFIASQPAPGFATHDRDF